MCIPDGLSAVASTVIATEKLPRNTIARAVPDDDEEEDEEDEDDEDDEEDDDEAEDEVEDDDEDEEDEDGDEADPIPPPPPRRHLPRRALFPFALCAVWRAECWSKSHSSSPCMSTSKSTIDRS